MENKNIDINIIKGYLAEENDRIKLKSFLRLYSNYSKLAKFSDEELENFENKIYTMDDKALSNKERIKKEIVIIKSSIKKCNNTEIVNYVNSILSNIDLILNYDDDVFNGYIPFLKKCICEIQSVLDLDMTFYPSSAPVKVAAASAPNALFASGSSPSFVRKPPCAAVPIKVPSVSKISIIVKIIVSGRSAEKCFHKAARSNCMKTGAGDGGSEHTPVNCNLPKTSATRRLVQIPSRIAPFIRRI